MYFLDNDNDGHWYIIPVRMRDEWITWLESVDDDDTLEMPEGIVQLGGHPNLVEFHDYTIV